MLQTLRRQVTELYEDADRAVLSFSQACSLKCPPGCVSCCYTEKVEATVLEMLPAAFFLFSSHQAEFILKRLESATEQCILFRPDLSTYDGGGCTLYENRALVCRLFGFAGNFDRTGKPRLAHCRQMPQSLTALSDNIPIFHNFAMVLSVISPSMGVRLMPINTALQEALYKVGLYLSMQPQISKDADNGNPDSPSNSPVTPKRYAA